MNKFVASTIIFAVGAVCGIAYGWASGFRDGQIQTASMGLSAYRKFSEIRIERNIEKAEKLADASAIAIASEITRSKSFSPGSEGKNRRRRNAERNKE